MKVISSLLLVAASLCAQAQAFGPQPTSSPDSVREWADLETPQLLWNAAGSLGGLLSAGVSAGFGLVGSDGRLIAVAGPAGLGILGLLLVIVVGIVGLFLYFLPFIIALSRGHHQTGMIFILNLFLGWTFLGWVVALALSFSAKR